MLTLTVQKRKDGEGAAQLRRAGSIPAVVYGAHHEATPISIPAIAFEKALKEAGEATVISLAGVGLPDGKAGAALPVLIHDVDYDPMTNHPRHVDFYAITKGEKVEVAIPLVFFGESPAVEAGANLVKVLHEIEVEADPMDLPRDIQVDISVLAVLDDQIHAKDLVLPKGVVLVTEPEEVIALVQEVVEEKEEAPVADLEAIEVEKKGKEEEEKEESPS
jgi:large subunit ribosomal protein L25